MASILDVLIDILKIDCGIATCYYPNEIEAMFYLFLFPTIFIILFIYILTNFIFRGGGMESKGIRLLISVGAYAFIVIDNLYTLFVSLSRVWWLLTIILVGLFAFLRFMLTGSEKKGGLPGVGGGAVGGYLSEAARDAVTGARNDIKKEIKARFSNMRAIIDQIKNPAAGTDTGKLIEQFRAVEGQAESAIDELNKRGKISGVNIEKLGNKYWDELKNIQREFRDAQKKHR